MNERVRGSLFLALVLGVLSLCAFGYAHRQTSSPVPVPPFVNGQTFLGWSENQRIIYTMGLMDGFATGASTADDSWRNFRKAQPPQCVGATAGTDEDSSWNLTKGDSRKRRNANTFQILRRSLNSVSF